MSVMVDHGSIEEVNKVTGKTVIEACAKMKAGKMDVSGGHSSDVAQ